MRATAVLATAIAIAAAAPAARAQEASPQGARWTASPHAAAPDDAGVAGAAGLPRDATLPAVAAGSRLPWWSPVASALLPGAGQAVQRQRRAIAYLAVESYLLAQYLQARSDARGRRDEYRRLAQIARSYFTNRFPNGDFEYYETMEKYVESGAFDLDPGPAIVPETDTTTFNGFTWRLARSTYWEDPDVPPPLDSDAYQNAVEFYQRRAYGPTFRWSWRDAQLEQDLFRRTIRSSNAAFRTSSDYLAMLIANHALSAVDAFVVLRLNRTPVAPGRSGYSLGVEVPWAPLGGNAGGAARAP